MTEPARKRSLGRRGKLLRLVAACLDPRAWVHLVRMVNYYNYTHVAPRRRLTIGPNAAISPDASFSEADRIVVGANARVGSRCHLWAGPSTGRIVIGDDVLIGPDVLVTAATYDFRRGRPVTDQPMTEADVVIGDDVWLAAKAVVLPGVTIGDGAVIGAGAVVCDDVPAMAVAAGAPARVVGARRLRAPASGDEGETA